MNKKELLLDLQNSDETAFRKLFELFYPKVKSFLIYSNLHDELDDILQDTFITIWNKRKSIDIERSFDSYVFTIAKNHALKALKKQVLNSIAFEDHNIQDHTASVEHFIDARILNEKINSSVEKLPPQPKVVFKMKRYQGMTTNQIAEELNLAPKTVENYMNTALSIIRKDLGHLAVFTAILQFLN